MSTVGLPSLAVHVCNCLILEMLRNKTPVILITPQNLSGLSLGPDYNESPPSTDDYQKIVNRLKVMSGLNPIGSDKTETGSFEMEVGGDNHAFGITIAAHDASVCLQVR